MSRAAPGLAHPSLGCSRCVLVLAAAAPAAAHPLGNFSVNHLSTVSISSDRVEVRYMLDQAEIPTVQERGLGPGGGAAPQARRGARAASSSRSTAGVRSCAPAARPSSASPPAPAGCPRPAWSSPSVPPFDDPQRVGAPRRHLPRPDRLEGDRDRARRAAPPSERTRRAAIRPTACAATRRTCFRARSTTARASFSVTAGSGTVIAPEGKRGGDRSRR